MIGVLNTRPADQAPPLSEALRAAGYEPAEVPLVELALMPGALATLRKLSESLYDGILLSSPNLLPLLRASGDAVPDAWRGKPWFLVGARAQSDVAALGAEVAYLPAEASLDGFLKELPARFTGLHLLHPCSAKTRLDPALFAAKGLRVHNMAVYEPRLPDGTAAALEGAWPGLSPKGAVLLASGSAVHHLFVAAAPLARTLVRDDGPLPVSIGASTSRALRMYGVHRHVQAPSADNAGFIAALQTAFSEIPT